MSATEPPPPKGLPENLQAAPVRIVVVAGDRALCAELEKALKTSGKAWVLRHFPDADNALRSVGDLRPAATVLEMALPDSAGIQCAQRLKALLPEMPIILVSDRVNPETVVSSLLLGACAYLLKPVEGPMLVEAIDRALRGLHTLCAEAEELALGCLNRSVAGKAEGGLTARERDLLALLLLRKSDKDISDELGISPGTVHSHLKELYRKLGAHNREQAVRNFLLGSTD
jgi:DNA-binding NarL/FixJ family response regulator